MKNWEMSQRKDPKRVEDSHKVKERTTKESRWYRLENGKPRGRAHPSAAHRAPGVPTGVEWWRCPMASHAQGKGGTCSSSLRPREVRALN